MNKLRGQEGSSVAGRLEKLIGRLKVGLFGGAPEQQTLSQSGSRILAANFLASRTAERVRATMAANKIARKEAPRPMSFYQNPPVEDERSFLAETKDFYEANKAALEGTDPEKLAHAVLRLQKAGVSVSNTFMFLCEKNKINPWEAVIRLAGFADGLKVSNINEVAGDFEHENNSELLEDTRVQNGELVIYRTLKMGRRHTLGLFAPFVGAEHSAIAGHVAATNAPILLADQELAEQIRQDVENVVGRRNIPTMPPLSGKASGGAQVDEVN